MKEKIIVSGIVMASLGSGIFSLLNLPSGCERLAIMVIASMAVAASLGYLLLFCEPKRKKTGGM